MNFLANTLRDERHYAEAEKLDREALQTFGRVLGPEDPDTLEAAKELAEVLADQGHYAEAEKLDRTTLDVARRALGPARPQTMNAIETLANILSHTGRYDEAQKLFRELIQTAIDQKWSATVAGYWFNFACGAAIAGQRDEALDYLREAIDHGYGHSEAMAADPDLKSLHGDPRFDAMIAKARQAAAATAQ